MLLFASYHYSERTRVTDWWRKTPDKSFLSTSVFVAFLLSYSLTLRQLRSYSLTWGSCSYSVTSNNRKRLLKIAQCEPGLRNCQAIQMLEIASWPLSLRQLCLCLYDNGKFNESDYWDSQVLFCKWLSGPDFLAPWPRRGIVRLIGLVSIFRSPLAQTWNR